MTYFINLRAGPFGAVCSPYVLSGDALTADPQLTAVQSTSVPYLTKGKNVLLAAHGFNVSYVQGVWSLQHLETALAIDPDKEVFFGVLWPGDWVVPAVNYPFEDGVASHAGKLLGGFCNSYLTGANSLSMLSHSLGARVILDAIKASQQRIRLACITAGAVNNDCLREEYAQAAANCDAFRTLSSRQDLVLELAYPPGDLLADALDPDHPPFEPALGRCGPAKPLPANVMAREIAPSPPYNHGNYFPPEAWTDPPLIPAGQPDWRNAVSFMAAAFRGATPAWP